MNIELNKIVHQAREFLKNHSLSEIDFQQLNKDCEKKIEKSPYFSKVDDLVKEILRQERSELENIFKENNYKNYNAIDTLFIVSQEFDNRFFRLTPSYTSEFQELYPKLYEEHTIKRKHFIFEKMKLNLAKGITQDLYKTKIETEAIKRLYTEQIVKFTDKDNYLINRDNFGTLFDKMIKSFIKLVANKNGLNYYRHRKQLFSALNFANNTNTQ